ncbi:MAG: hypothetical protein KY467_11975 [Gemmatimonadetes bacterium]|nr:hypothetical protein [Gemmatimonadota bacterium]
MADELTAIPAGTAQGGSTTLVLDGEVHKVLNGDADYELTVHPAFASACTVTKNGVAHGLYQQAGTHQLNGKPVPKKHTIRLKAKKGKKDITLTLNDAAHSVKKITIELYKDEHDPTKKDTTTETDTVFTVENDAKLCPPNCGT